MELKNKFKKEIKQFCLDIMVTEENYSIIRPIVILSRIAGLCPVVFYKIGNNYRMKYSILLLIYSYLLVIGLAVWSVLGLVADFQAGEDAIRLKNSKNTYISICDIFSTIIIAVYGVMSVPYRMKNLWSLIVIWAEVDSFLPISDFKKYKKYSKLFLGFSFLTIAGVFLYDMSYYALFTEKSNFVFFQNFTAYYVLYMLMISQELFLWHLIYFIHIRVISLNRSILTEKRNIIKAEESKNVFVIPYTIASKSNEDKFSSSQNQTKMVVEKKRTPIHLKKMPSDELFHELVKIYVRIKESIHLLNNSPSFGVVLLTLSCLIHLVITPYFLLIEVFNRRSLMFITSQALWLLAHVGRLLMIIEPCEKCINECIQTREILCSILTLDINEDRRKAVNLFILHLNNSVFFEASGFFKINRSLFTTISGAVTTYLVILFQFNNAFI